MKRNLPLLISFAVFIASLFLPALHGRGSSIDGLVLLFFGWTQAVDALCFAWLANLAIAAGAIFYLLRQFMVALWSSVIAMVIGLDTFRATVFPSDAGGMNVQIDAIGSAFYVWELSFAILAATSIYMVLKERKKGAN
ncbi:hypothetical protein FKV23_16270 [Lysobacter alkalisoli]|uniref:Uncharacterized protein n=2 Tax=Marilutibacter alkalisoli TaxID=2591633 RepID=A0A514BVN8_9GAMM|nr:hypothetical protein FKV23_16270 [Lysobacter alkalisoli]